MGLYSSPSGLFWFYEFKVLWFLIFWHILIAWGLSSSISDNLRTQDFVWNFYIVSVLSFLLPTLGLVTTPLPPPQAPTPCHHKTRSLLSSHSERNCHLLGFTDKAQKGPASILLNSSPHSFSMPPSYRKSSLIRSTIDPFWPVLLTCLSPHPKLEPEDWKCASSPAPPQQWHKQVLASPWSGKSCEPAP